MSLGLIYFFLAVTLGLRYLYLLSKGQKNGLFSDGRAVQLGFIMLTAIMGLIALHRAFSAFEHYQRVIGFVGFGICFIIMVLLIAGLKHYKE